MDFDSMMADLARLQRQTEDLRDRRFIVEYPSGKQSRPLHFDALDLAHTEAVGGRIFEAKGELLAVILEREKRGHANMLREMGIQA